MDHFVYIIINKITGKCYIGSHTGDINDSYLGSEKIIKRSIKKYGQEEADKRKNQMRSKMRAAKNI